MKNLHMRKKKAGTRRSKERQAGITSPLFVSGMTTNVAMGGSDALSISRLYNYDQPKYE